MAYVLNPLDPTQQATGATGTAAPVQVANGPSGDVSGSTTSPAAPSGAAPTAQTGTSGGFTNIGAYLNANAAGATNLGQQSAGLINGTDATNTINQASADWKNAVAGGTDTYNPDLVSQALANPTAAVGNTDLQKQMAGAYSGPTTYAGSGQDAASISALQKADQQAQLAATSGGRTQLLQQLSTGAGATPYTSGGLNLNQYLEQNSPDALSAIQGAASTEANLTPQYQGATSAANQALVNPAQATSAATGAKTNAALTGGENDLRTQINNEVAAKKTAVGTQNTNLQGALAGQKPGQAATPGKPAVAGTPASTAPNPNLKSVMVAQTGPATPGTPGTPAVAGTPATAASFQNMTADQLAQLGITQTQLDNLNQLNQQLTTAGGKPVDLSTYMTGADANAVNAGNTATADEQSRYNALNQILGTQPGNYLQNSGPQGKAAFNAAGAETAIRGQLQGQQQAAAQAKTQSDAAAAAAAASSQSKANQQKNDTMGGALIGAKVGSSFGPWGTAIGAAIGALAANTSRSTVLNSLKAPIVQPLNAAQHPIQTLQNAVSNPGKSLGQATGLWS